MIRKIIHIDAEKCSGCGKCARACHEGAIGMVNGRAVLLREDYCDGLGNCLPACPEGAITFEEREAAPFNKEAFQNKVTQWPLQIRLVPVTAPYFQGADLLVAADCTAFAYVGFHEELMKNRITIIGCPKLDRVDYSEKLGEILENNDINSLTVARMEVPCCGGLEYAARHALQKSGKHIPFKVVTISIAGEIIEEKEEGR